MPSALGNEIKAASGSYLGAVGLAMPTMVAGLVSSAGLVGLTRGKLLGLPLWLGGAAGVALSYGIVDVVNQLHDR